MNSLLARMAAALIVPVVVAALFHPLLGRGRRLRLAALVALSIPVLGAPLLIAAEHPVARFFVAVHCAVIVCGMVDQHRTAGSSTRTSLLGYVLFMIHPAHLVRSHLGVERGPGRRANLVRLARGVVEASLGGAALWWAFTSDIGRHGFAVDHVVKLLALYPALDGVVVFLTAGLRLVGIPTQDLYRDPILADTPADFWRRYNRVVGQFLRVHVFGPAGGRRAPVRGILVAFLVSSILHEYIFWIAIGRIQGYQTAFFMIQGVGVAATARLEPKGVWRVVGIAGTLAFNLVTMVLFFASGDALLGWHQGRGLLP